MTMVKRKHLSTEDAEQEPKAKLKCEIPKPKKVKKSVKLEKPAEMKKHKYENLKKFKKGHGNFSSKKPLQNNKPNWNEFKKKKKELKKTRKEQKCSVYEVTCKTKQLWEKVRRSDCPLDQRESLIQEMYKLLEHKCEKVVFTHDASRVLQWMLKIGPPVIRASITCELTPHIPTMLQSKYACFCVKRMLKYGSHESRKLMIRSLHGSVVKLASHSVAAPIFEYMYSMWTSAAEKSLLRQEFYGDMYKQDKESSVHRLEEMFEKVPTMKNAILSTVKANLTRILGKKLMNSSLVHTVLCEYLRHCSDEDRNEVLEQIQTSLLDLTKTKDGAHVALLCIWHASNKAKKSIMKSLKGHMMEVAQSEYGHLIPLALFDTVDDTVVLKKMLVPELLGDLWSLANNEYGRKVVLYMVAHRDPLYFHPTEVALLNNGAALSSRKKDEELRRCELLNAISDPLLETIRDDAGNWLCNSSISMVTLAVLKSGKGPTLKEALEAVADHINDTTNKISEGEKEYDLVEHAGTHLMLKKLIQHDKERMKHTEVTFSSILVSRLSDTTLLSWIKYNRGCFILVALMESSVQSAVSQLQEKLQPLASCLDKQISTGGKILMKKIT